jgi:hypothetical protein
VARRCLPHQARFCRPASYGSARPAPAGTRNGSIVGRMVPKRSNVPRTSSSEYACGRSGYLGKVVKTFMVKEGQADRLYGVSLSPPLWGGGGAALSLELAQGEPAP